MHTTPCFTGTFGKSNVGFWGLERVELKRWLLGDKPTELLGYKNYINPH